MKTNNRFLEGIVPSQYKTQFGLIAEDGPPAPDFKFKTPKTDDVTKDDATKQPEKEPIDSSKQDPAPTTDKKPAGTNDQSKWLMKKLVGTLKYAGAMATEVRGSHADDAGEINDIVNKVIDDLKTISQSLEQYSTKNDQQEKPVDGGDDVSTDDDGSNSTS